MKNESLQRRVKGERDCVQCNLNNNKDLLTDMVRETFEKKMEDLIEEKRKSEKLFSHYAKRTKEPLEGNKLNLQIKRSKVVPKMKNSKQNMPFSCYHSLN